MLISLIRTVIIYIVIIAAVRIMGKRQISELQTTELVVTLLISDLAVIPMQDSGQTLFSGLIPIFILIACEIIVTLLMLKSGKLRRIICGKPIIIVDRGIIVQKTLKELRISTEDLYEQLRQKDVFSIDEVLYGIVETNGSLSIIKKPEYESIKQKDIGMDSPTPELEVVVISDGELAPSSMEICGLSKDRINQILDDYKIKKEEVFIMTADQNGKYKFIPKEKA